MRTSANPSVKLNDVYSELYCDSLSRQTQRRRFNVYNTFIRRWRRRIDVLWALERRRVSTGFIVLQPSNLKSRKFYTGQNLFKVNNKGTRKKFIEVILLSLLLTLSRYLSIWRDLCRVKHNAKSFPCFLLDYNIFHQGIYRV